MEKISNFFSNIWTALSNWLSVTLFFAGIVLAFFIIKKLVDFIAYVRYKSSQIALSENIIRKENYYNNASKELKKKRKKKKREAKEAKRQQKSALTLTYPTKAESKDVKKELKAQGYSLKIPRKKNK